MAALYITADPKADSRGRACLGPIATLAVISSRNNYSWRDDYSSNNGRSIGMPQALLRAVTGYARPPVDRARYYPPRPSGSRI
jgi:hypothetical protein